MTVPGLSRLAVRHLLAIIAVTLVFWTGAVAYQIRTQYAAGLRGLDEVLRMVEASYVRPIAAGVFFFDDHQLALLADGIALLPYVDSVMIAELRGEDEVPIVSAGLTTNSGDEVHEFPLVFEYDGRHREIGMLRIITSLAELRERIAEQIRVTVFGTLFMIGGYAVVVLLVAQRMIFRHLKLITAFLHGLDPERITGRILARPHRIRITDAPDELDEIADAINMMLERLGGALKEKTSLLHELYHRTGNMMQSVRAILQLESTKDGVDDRFRSTVRSVDNRILALALVHRKLYQFGTISRINMRSYLSDLAQEILSSYHGVSARVGVEVDAEPTSLLIDSAIPCGTIVSELLSNSLQHAFPGDRHGTILVLFRRLDDQRHKLTVRDNGVGMNHGFDYRTAGTIGIQTVVAVAEQQLCGRIGLDGHDGVDWRIDFSADVYQERVHDG